MSIDRRRAARRVPVEGEPLSHVRLRGGRELGVVDISNAGVLVEGGVRLLPGTHLDVHVISPDGRVLVRSRVTRAYVCDVQADAVRYRGAFAFERLVDTAAGYGIPATIAPSPNQPGSDHPAGTAETLALAVERVVE